MVSVAGALGIGSGIDTQKLVADLVAAQRKTRDTALATRSERNSARISALAQVRAGLDSLASALDSLGKSGALGAQPVSADPTIVAVSRRPGATPAPFTRTVEVNRLAAAQTLASRRFASATEPVGLGTLTFSFGTATVAGGDITGLAADPARAAKTVTIGAGQDSLAGLRDAINAAGTGVTATIVNDGDGVRLQLRGESGATNGFQIAVTPATGSPAGGALADFAFAPGASALDLSSEAVNARLTVDGLAVERRGNFVTDLVDGFALDLRRAAPGTPVKLTADRDPAQLAAVAQSFVEAYNGVQGLIREAAKGRTADTDAGPLYGQAAIRSLADQLAQLTSRRLATGSGSVSLAEVGIRTQRDGSLAVDADALDAAIARDPTVFEKLFAPSQAASDGGVRIANAVGAAKPGTYEVTGVSPATAGSFVGIAVPAAFDFPVDVSAANASFTLELDGGAPLSLSLAVGSYTSGAALAAAFEAAINNSASLVPPGTRVRVGWDAGTFRFLSLALGSRSAVRISGLDPALATRLGLDGASATAGVNAAGTIAGVEAIGNGTRLSASASSSASGLSLDIGAVTASSFTVSVGEGLSGAVARIRDSLNRGDGGLVATAARFEKETKSISDESAKISARSDEYSTSLARQFAAMERAVASYKSIGEFLTQQIDAWNNQNKR